jgi:hypothetical protein
MRRLGPVTHQEIDVSRAIRFALVITTLSAFACSSTPGQPELQNPDPQSAPPASAGHNLVYADDLEMVLLVNAGLGGVTSPPASTKTRVWGWTGAEWRLLDSAGPPVRNLAGVAYDSRRRTLVMHGGTYDVGRSYGETWEWTRQGGWRQFTGAGPGLRDHTQMAYDAERGRAVLFGGSGDNPNIAFADTWEFDGTRWERVAPAAAPARVHHALQYDPTLRRVVTFGGFTPGTADLGDTWAWDGTRWTSLTPATTPRTHARMAFHRRLNAMLLVGGFRVSSGLGAIVRRDAGWTPLTASPEPSARYLPDVAYDAKRDVFVLFGGGDPNGSSLFADTWEHDGTTWRRIRER